MMKKYFVSLLLMLVIHSAQVLAASAPSEKLIELNTIVAIVNETPILQSTLEQRMDLVKRELEARHIALPPIKILKTQVLNQLIQEQLQLQLANNRHIQISQYQLNQQLQKIASEQKLTIAEIYQQAIQDGYTRDSYRQQLQDQMCIHELIQMAVAAKIIITPQDVTLYRNSQLAHATSGKLYQVENILIPLPASPTVEEVSTAQAKAQALLTDIKQGKIAFDQAAVRNSSGQFALEGGDLGLRSIAELPEIFASLVSAMSPGDVAGPIRAANGIQLIKLVAVKGQQQKLTDEEIHAALFKRKLEEAYPLWLAGLESQAYIDRKI